MALTIAPGQPAMLDIDERPRSTAEPWTLQMTVIPDRLSGSGKLMLEVHAGAHATGRPLAVYAFFPPAQLGREREIVLTLQVPEAAGAAPDRISIHVKGAPGFGTDDHPVVLRVPSYTLR